jgi:hypothetical protein
MTDQSTWHAALLDPTLPAPRGLVSWNGSDTQQRFAVYRNNVIVSLIAALADSFRVVRLLVGDEFFRAMAREFARAHPPRTPVLGLYGDAFPAFLAAFPPATGLPYLADVARLELAYQHALHAADDAPVPRDRLAAALGQSERLASLRLGIHPSLATVRSAYAVASLWAAHQGEIDIRSVDPYQPETAWVLRNGLSVRVLRMTAGDCEFVDALRTGALLAAAADRAAAANADFDLTRCLTVLLVEQAITTVDDTANS